MPQPIDREAIRAYVARDWQRARDDKRRYWAQRLEANGLREALEVTQQLRSWMMQVDGSWPTQAQREDDLQTHQRVAEALAKTRHAKPATSRARARRPR